MESPLRLPADQGFRLIETMLWTPEGGFERGDVHRKRLAFAARRLGLAAGTLAPAAPADLVLFDPSVPFVLDRVALRSKSRNTPFDGARMEGKVLGTWVGGRRVFGA